MTWLRPRRPVAAVAAPVFVPATHGRWTAQAVGQSSAGVPSSAFQWFQEYPLVQDSASSFVARSVTILASVSAEGRSADETTETPIGPGLPSPSTTAPEAAARASQGKPSAQLVAVPTGWRSSEKFVHTSVPQPNTRVDVGLHESRRRRHGAEESRCDEIRAGDAYAGDWGPAQPGHEKSRGRAVVLG